jgi:hypothetical protein
VIFGVRVLAPARVAVPWKDKVVAVVEAVGVIQFFWREGAEAITVQNGALPQVLEKVIVQEAAPVPVVIFPAESVPIIVALVPHAPVLAVKVGLVLEAKTLPEVSIAKRVTGVF